MAECGCGCGNQTAGGRFLPGHDSILRANAEHRAGGVERLAKLVDAAQAFRAGTMSLEAFGRRVTEIVPAEGEATSA